MELKKMEQKIFFVMLIASQYCGAIMGAFILWGLATGSMSFSTDGVLFLVPEVMLTICGVGSIYIVIRRLAINFKRWFKTRKVSIVTND